MSKPTQQDRGGQRKQPEDGSRSQPAKTAKVEKIPDSGSHEDFSDDADGLDGGNQDASKTDKQKGRKEYTGSTESGEEDKGAKYQPG